MALQARDIRYSAVLRDDFELARCHVMHHFKRFEDGLRSEGIFAKDQERRATLIRDLQTYHRFQKTFSRFRPDTWTCTNCTAENLLTTSRCQTPECGQERPREVTDYVQSLVTDLPVLNVATLLCQFIQNVPYLKKIYLDMARLENQVQQKLHEIHSFSTRTAIGLVTLGRQIHRGQKREYANAEETPHNQIWAGLVNICSILSDTLSFNPPNVADELLGPGDVTCVSLRDGIDNTPVTHMPLKRKEEVLKYVAALARKLRLATEPIRTCTQVLAVLRFASQRCPEYVHLLSENGISVQPGRHRMNGAYADPKRVAALRGLKLEQGCCTAGFFINAALDEDDETFLCTAWDPLLSVVTQFQATDKIITQNSLEVNTERDRVDLIRMWISQNDKSLVDASKQTCWSNWISADKSFDPNTPAHYYAAGENFTGHSLLYCWTLLDTKTSVTAKLINFNTFCQWQIAYRELKDCFETWVLSKNPVPGKSTKTEREVNHSIEQLQAKFASPDHLWAPTLFQDVLFAQRKPGDQGNSFRLLQYLCNAYGIKYSSLQITGFQRDGDGRMVRELSNPGSGVWEPVKDLAKLMLVNDTAGSVLNPRDADVQLFNFAQGLSEFFDDIKRVAMGNDAYIRGLMIRLGGLAGAGGHYQALSPVVTLNKRSGKYCERPGKFNNGSLLETYDTYQKAVRANPFVDTVIAYKKQFYPEAPSFQQPNLRLDSPNNCYIAAAFVLFLPLYDVLKSRRRAKPFNLSVIVPDGGIFDPELRGGGAPAPGTGVGSAAAAATTKDAVEIDLNESLDDHIKFRKQKNLMVITDGKAREFYDFFVNAKLIVGGQDLVTSNCRKVLWKVLNFFNPEISAAQDDDSLQRIVQEKLKPCRLIMSGISDQQIQSIGVIADVPPPAKRLKGRTLHLQYTTQDGPRQVYGQLTPQQFTVPPVKVIKNKGGSETYGYELSQQKPAPKIGVMVAGNSGKPGGACADWWKTYSDGKHPQYVPHLAGAFLKDKPPGVRKDQIHANHTTQEEDIVSCWLQSESHTNRVSLDEAFKPVANEWGMTMPNLSLASGDLALQTIQGRNYRTNRDDPWGYADAWTVQNARLCPKTLTGLQYNDQNRGGKPVWKNYDPKVIQAIQKNSSIKQFNMRITGRSGKTQRYTIDLNAMTQTNALTKKVRKIRRVFQFDTKQTYEAALVFVSGPNGNVDNKGPYSSTTRTFNAEAKRNVRFFTECVKCAIRVGLDAMAKEGVTVALVARVSNGIYAPHSFRTRFRANFPNLVDQVLKERVRDDGLQRGCFFTDVCIVDV